MFCKQTLSREFTYLQITSVFGFVHLLPVIFTNGQKCACIFKALVHYIAFYSLVIRFTSGATCTSMELPVYSGNNATYLLECCIRVFMMQICMHIFHYILNVLLE